MIIVSDTSAITSLLQVNRAEILSRLYNRVIVPEEVARELRQFHSTLPEFLQIEPVIDRERFDRLRVELDAGEAAAISLMIEGRGDLLLIDERRGRAKAAEHNIRVIGVVGVLVEARRRNLFPSLKQVIHELENVAGFRLSSALKQRALAAAGE